MENLKTLICAALLVAGLCGCKKIDVNKLEGTWSEQYDPKVFAMDGFVEYTFDGSNHYQMHVYDALSGESRDYSGTQQRHHHHQSDHVGLQQCHLQACEADIRRDGMAEGGDHVLRWRLGGRLPALREKVGSSYWRSICRCRISN